jgi:putative ABC transport system permease protein
METLLQDLRYSIRQFVKKPGFTIAAVVMLALGIGANTAIFSVVNRVLLRPLPYQNPDRLVLVKENLPRLGWSLLSASPAEYLDYKEGNEVFSEIAAYRELSVNLTGRGDPQRIQAARVSATLFPMLGINPLYGRAFWPEEDRVGSNYVIILSHRLWQRQFGADPDVAGKTVKLDDQPYVVVGVMPERFQFPYTWTSFADRAELWVPLALTDQEKKNRAGSFDYGVIGRLKPGVTLGEAQADIEAVAARARDEHPDIYRGSVEVTVTVESLDEDVVKGARPLLLVLLGAVGMVLAIACANVANLLLARASVRQKEIAIRSAMGASRLRLLRQLLTESLLLSIAGGAVGVLCAAWAVDLIVRFGPDNVPRLEEVSLDPAALSFTLIVSLLTGILFGLAPALQITRLNINEVIKEAGGRAPDGREGKRLRGMLVIFETASALVLLVGAGLLVNSFVRLLKVPPGFEPEGVVIARTAMPLSRYRKGEQSRVVYKQVLDKLSALPGVQAASVATNLPLTGEWTIGFLIEGRADDQIYNANNTWVSKDYFRAMGIALRTGRAFTDEDREDTPPVIVINEALRRTFWPGGDAIGKRIRWGGWGDGEWLTIVGVVGDVKISSLEAEPAPAIYMPIFQVPRARTGVIYVARTSGDAASLAAAMRHEIATVDPDLPVYDIRTMSQVIAESLAERRFSMLLIILFACAALLLAAFGLYSVMSYSVTERRHEIGVRMALGAGERDVLKLVVGHAMMLTMIGVALGLLASFALTRLMTSLLYGVSATDPVTFAGISLLLTGVALGASYVPARRAANVDPMIVIRYE